MLDPKKDSPHDLLDRSNTYLAPVFQRLYTWGEKQLQELMEDLDLGADEPTSETSGRPVFLGAVVLQALGKKSGATGTQEYLVIDGQQRITTIYLLLVALARLARENKLPEIEGEIARTYLAHAKRDPNACPPRFVPTSQDRGPLWKLLKENVLCIPWDFGGYPSSDDGPEMIPAQFVRILGVLKERLLKRNEKLDRPKFDALYERVTRGLQFVTITLESEDNAYEVFARLNVSGIPLTLADLVRNEVIRKCQTPEGAKRFYEDEWLPFEKRLGDEDSLNEYLVQFAFIRFEGDVTKKGAFESLRKAWSLISQVEILKELKEYVEPFLALKGVTSFTGDAELREAVERISRMPTATVTWPFLMRVLLEAKQANLDGQKALDCLAIVEAFMVRRSLMGKEPTGLHAVFKYLWSRSKGDRKLVKRFIISGTIDLPNNADIKKKLLKEAADSRRVLGFVFQELERDLRREKRGDKIPANLFEDQTIEHVLPRERNTDWKHFNTSDHARFKGLIGNLVPLSKPQNSSVQDDSWAEKRIRFECSNWQLAQEAATEPSWTKQTIRQRGNRLIIRILKRWAIP